MQARVLAFKSASLVLSQALSLYLNYVFYDSNNHHLLLKCFKDTSCLKDVIQGLVMLFTPPTRLGSTPHDDLTAASLQANGRHLSNDELLIAKRSKRINYAMIQVQREFEKRRTVEEVPKIATYSLIWASIL